MHYPLGLWQNYDHAFTSQTMKLNIRQVVDSGQLPRSLIALANYTQLPIIARYQDKLGENVNKSLLSEKQREAFCRNTEIRSTCQVHKITILFTSNRII